MAQKLMLLLMASLMAVSTDLYLPAIPDLIRDLGVSEAQGQLSLSIFMVGGAFGQLIYGPLSDYYGRKPVLAAGLWLFIAASVLCALAPSMQILLLGRLLQGLTAACGPVLARAMVSDRYTAAEAASVMAAVTGAMAIVPAIAPIFGGWLLLVFPWRAQFIALALLAIVAWLASTRTSESCPSIGVGSIRPRALARSMSRCLRDMRFLGYAVCGGGAYGAMFCWISTTAYIVIDLLGVAPENFGYTFMVVVAGYVLGARFSSRHVQSRGAVALIRRGFVVGSGGAVLAAALAITETPSLPLLLLAMAMVFHYGGLVLANCQMSAITLFPEAAGNASSVFGFIQSIMVAIAGAVAGAFYDQSLMPTVLCIIGAMMVSGMGLMIANAGAAPPQQTT